MADKNKKTVEAYIAGLSGWQQDAVALLRAIIKEAAPQAKESIKWAQPVFEANGPFAYIKAFSNSVNCGFWRGAELNDPKALLAGEGERMKHIQLRSLEDIKKPELHDFVRQALALNQKLGDPTKRKAAAG
jgi:hypothetical protein